jgi:hypothetical protein
MLGYVESKSVLGTINSVGIINDAGGSGWMPVGRYRIEVTRTWNDYEIGLRGEGTLLDEADIEIARKAGETGHPQSEFDTGDPRLDKLLASRTGPDRVREVFFPISDFTPEAS